MRRKLSLFVLCLSLLALGFGCGQAPEEAKQEKAPAQNEQQAPAAGHEQKPAEQAAEQAAPAEDAAPALGSGEKMYLSFGGGPVGGTFNSFANGMALLLTQTYPQLDVSAEGTGGSTANLRLLNSHDLDFGIVYMGDAYLGRKGRLPQDENLYENVQAVAYLYGAPAHLVVRADSGITSAMDLKGKRVGVGNAGSGAAAAAERFFRHLGVWDAFEPQYLGYSAAASAFNDRKLDAFWVLVGYPNSSVIEAATRDQVKLIDVAKDAEASGFYNEYPFYAPVEIPANTYPGQEAPVLSFQDSAYWMANKDVPEDVTYESVKTVFSEDGLKHMVATMSTAKSMSVEGALSGVAVPVHPGAARFWKEKGLNVPSAQ